MVSRPDPSLLHLVSIVMLQPNLNEIVRDNLIAYFQLLQPVECILAFIYLLLFFTSGEICRQNSQSLLQSHKKCYLLRFGGIFVSLVLFSFFLFEMDRSYVSFLQINFLYSHSYLSSCQLSS